MTVSVAIPSLSGGGAEKVTLLLVRELIRAGAISKVYVGTSCEASNALECEVVALGGRRASQCLGNFLKNVLSDPAETYMLTLGYINFAPFLRLIRPGTRIIVRLGNTPTPEIARLSRMSRFRYVASSRLATYMATEVVAQCHYMATDVRNLFGVNSAKIRVIFNPIEPALAEYPTDRVPVIELPYIFVAATFKPQKDLETLVAGFALSKNKFRRKLVIAGVSPDDLRFKELVDHYRLTDREVICLGFSNDIYNWIQGSDLCILTSKYEGFSNFLLEAASLGKRIVATDCPGGNAELFQYYKNAITFPIGDHAYLAELMDLPRQDLSRTETQAALSIFAFDSFLERFHKTLNT